jgi:signal transduction histidine kinase
VIDGNAQRMLRKLDTLPRDRITDALEKTRSAVAKLIELMETVLSSSKIDAGTIEFNPGPCPLLDMLEEAIEDQQELSKNHRIIADIAELNSTIVADKKLVRHIFANLLSNAVKYSPNADAIWVDGRVKGSYVVISFRDEGVGIPKEQIEKLFVQFFRATTSKGIAGTGIGLNLVKKLVELHGGSVTVESAEGEGSTFTIILPINGPGDGQSEAPATAALEPAISVDA